MASLALAFDVLAKDHASKTFDKVGDKAEKTGRRVDRAGRDGGKGFGAGIGSGVKIAAGALAGLSLGRMFVGFVKDAAESAKIGRLTDAVIKSTGGSAKISAKQVSDLATSISNKTGVDDEAIQSAENLLLTFTNVRNEVGKGNDIFNQATSTVTDMAAALGSDPQKAAIQLGKALNDPVKGVSALQKVGVSFTAQQKKQIKSLVEHGKTLDAQKIILKELSTEFGGAAAAASSPMDRLKVTLGNVGEEIGGVLLPSIERGAAFLTDKFIPAARQIIGVLFKGDFKGGGPFAEDSGFIAGVFSTRDALKELFAYFKAEVLPRLKDFAGFLKDDVLPKVIALGKFVKRNKDFFVPFVGIIIAIVAALKVWTAVQLVLDAVLTANPIGLIVVAIAAFVAGIIYAYKHSEKFRKIVDGAMRGVAVAIDFVRDHWKAFALGFALLIGGPILGALILLVTHFGKVKAVAVAVFKAITGAVSSTWGWIKSHWPLLLSILTGPVGAAVIYIIRHWDQIVAVVKSLPGRISSAASGMWDGIKNSFRSAVNWIIGKWNDLSFTIGGGDVFGKKLPSVTLNTPNIPFLALGGDITRSGRVLVGDAGPEILDLPRGARVTPLDRADTSAGLTINVPMTVYGTDEIVYDAGRNAAREVLLAVTGY